MVLIVVCTVLATIAQLSFKLSSASIDLSLASLINPYLVVGLLAYGVTSLLFVAALKFGELSVLYPIWSLSFVWITIASIFLLDESVTLLNWAGIGLIISGISMIGLGARNG